MHTYFFTWKKCGKKMIICQGDNSSKANKAPIKDENISIFVFNHLGYWCKCLYYTKLIVSTEKLNDNQNISIKYNYSQSYNPLLENNKK